MIWIVRTSSEQRLSNFMLCARRSELMLIEKNWPDMTVDDVSVILEYANRNRRFGNDYLGSALGCALVLILLVVSGTN